MASYGDTDLSGKYSPTVRLHAVNAAIPDQKALYFAVLNNIYALSIR